MDNISIEIFKYFEDILKAEGLDTEFFISHYSYEEFSHIKEHNNGVTLSFDITMDDTDNMRKYILKVPELHETGVICDYEEYENKWEYDKGKRKYMLDITISKYFIRNFKLKKLLL